MEKTQKKQETVVNVKGIWTNLKNHWVLILVVGMICGGAAFAITKYVIPQEYMSTTRIYVMPQSNSTNSDSNYIYSDLSAGTQLTQDYLELVQSRSILEGVISKLNLDMSYEDLSKKVTASTTTGTRILTISVYNEDPQTAKDIADSIREAVQEQVKTVMNVESANTVDEANLPVKSARPSVVKYTAFSAVIGILAAALFLTISFLHDDTLKSADDVKDLLGMGTLAEIPLRSDSNEDKKKNRKTARKFSIINRK
ncbi:MAG: YveK family protein [Eubacteriaceae bacterium]|jgi:capsular polysaccharide biosynthesis protein